MSNIPTEDSVIHALARRFYFSFCEKKGWTPHPFPYCDADSIRYARIAVDYLGFDETIDVTDPAW